MSNSPTPWPIEGIRKVVAFLPVFESSDFIPAIWDPPLKRLIEGVEVTSMPYPTYSIEVERFWETFAGTGGFINPYEGLPEDGDEWSARVYDGQKPIDLEYLSSASVDQVRRYLSLTKRGERFGDGHIESQFKNGHMVVALSRLKQLIDGGFAS